MSQWARANPELAEAGIDHYDQLAERADRMDSEERRKARRRVEDRLAVMNRLTGGAGEAPHAVDVDDKAKAQRQTERQEQLERDARESR